MGGYRMSERSLSAKGGVVGFSMVELLVVIAIMAVLLAMTLPSIQGARRVAVQAQCASVMRQAGVGMSSYRIENREYLFRISLKTGSTPTSTFRFNLNSLATYHASLESYTPAAARYCPSVAKPDKTQFEWAYTSPVLDNSYGARYFMAGRASAPGTLNATGYVKMVEGPARYGAGSTSNPALLGAIYRNHSTGKSYDPIRALPLLADYLQTSFAAAPSRVAAHNGGNAVVTNTPRIDSDGGNTLWEDLHVEWHNWPMPARSFDSPELSSSITRVNQYPFYAATGLEPEGWVSSGSEYVRNYFWVKVAQRD